MAGSYKHCVDENGRLRIEPLLDNLGDASEAIEEMYYMIQILAVDNPVVVEEARKEALVRITSNRKCP